MKSTGIVRKLDQLGRVVLPMELRKTMEIQEGTPLQIFIDGPNIILKKYQPDCIFCNSVSDVQNYKGKNICNTCLKELKK